MNSSERRLNLILLLQSKQKWNVDQLAEYFGVSRRTIFRDMRTLSEINVPVTYDKETGYGMMKGYTIPPIMFSPKEISTILVGLSFVKSQIDNTLVLDAKAVETKIQSILPSDDLKKFMETLGTSTIVDPYKRFGTEKKPGGDWFTIANAIANGHKISFDYASFNNSGTAVRRVNPWLLVYYTDHWTLIGLCNTRNESRRFRLDRMSYIELLTEPFNTDEIPKEIDILFDNSGDEIEVKIWVGHDAVQVFRSSVPAKIISSEADRDGIAYTFRFNNLDYLNNWLFSFHDSIKVLAPDDLIKRRILKIQSMLMALKG
jgi:predicted DNA-binding transcriptional regulator YafY